MTKLRLINWHYFNNVTINFKNTNLFSGDNGAGKSTILDAMQLILTTNSRRFNLAANTDSKRNLKNYVRGKTGEEGNEFIRKGAVISYVALEIYEEAKQRYFILGVKIDSPDLESVPKKKWFCEEGRLEQLSFITDNKPSRDEQFKNNGKKISFMQTTQAKDRFKARLGHLQDNFFELLSRSLAFKPMKDVKSFVSQFILPERNVDIAALRENIRNLKEMQLVVEEVKKQVDDLKNIQDKYNDIMHFDYQILVIEILIKLAEQEAKDDEITDKTKTIKLEEQNIAQYSGQSKALKDDINTLNERYTDILSAIKSGETAQMIATIKADISNKKKDKELLSEKVKKLKTQLNRISAASRFVFELTQNDCGNIVVLDNDTADTQHRNNIVIELESAFEEAKKKIQEKLTETNVMLKDVNEKLETLSKEIGDLERNKITYDRNITALRDLIESEFSARGISSDVHILADLLEISDTKWQNAIEGYLNTQKFYIIVEPQYYDIAAEVYDRNKSRIHTAAIVNTAKLDTKIVHADTSLASVVKSENIYARAYVNYLLGRVTMCESVSQLKEHSIAITKGCMLYQGNALRKIDPKTYYMPYIGKYALAQQLKIKKEEHAKLLVKKKELDGQKVRYDTVQASINNCNFEILKDVVGSPVDLKKVNDDLEKLKKDLKEAENDPTYLKLQMDAETIKNQLDEKSEELKGFDKKILNGEFVIKSLNDQIRTRMEEKAILSSEIEKLCNGKESARAEANKKFEDHKKTKTAGTIYNNYQPRKAVLLNQKTDAIGKLSALQTKYKDGEFGTGINMMPDYTEEYNNLTRHDLISYEDKLRTIRENCETEFKESFLAKMRENIEKAKTLFKELNKTLKPIYYGNDSYRFDWAPDKKKKRLYDMITSEVNIGGFNLFSTQFDEEYHDEMDELFSKLTVSDENGDDVINEYTDYRSYLDYDIDIVSKDGKTQKFSKIYREKSGGETQTPYYVAIAASFVQLYSIGETIRVIMLDEAFDKMDEERIASMLTFFKAQDLQVILAAPTSRLELIGEHADNIIMIFKDDEHNSIAEEFSYDEI
ncbi:ATP-binding protein [Ruminococcus albus]|nr:SbcC/MukB-like Walker B domain-containing protein [Ruminococcus albus]